MYGCTVGGAYRGGVSSAFVTMGGLSVSSNSQAGLVWADSTCQWAGPHRWQATGRPKRERLPVCRTALTGLQMARCKCLLPPASQCGLAGGRGSSPASQRYTRSCLQMQCAAEGCGHTASCTFRRMRAPLDVRIQELT